MKYLKKIQQNNIQRYMLMSYLIIACISVFVEFILCAYMIINTGTQLKEKHEVELDKAIFLFDQQLADISEASRQLSESTLVKKILGYSAYPRYHGSDVLDIKSMMELFEDKVSYCNQIEDIMLISRTKNTTITSEQIYHRESCDKFLKASGIDVSELKNIHGEQKTKMIIFNQSEYQKYIYFVQGIYKKSYTIPEGYIVVKIDMGTLNGLLKNFEETKDSRCFLINQTEGYMGTDINDEVLVSKILEKQQPSGNVFLNSGFYSYSIADSQYMNVEYCYVTSIFKYYKAVFVTIFLTIISMIGMAAASIWLANRFAVENTNPLRKIMATIEAGWKGDLKDKAASEFNYEHIVSGVTGIVGKMQSYEQQLQQDMLALIMHGQEKSRKKILEFQNRNQESIGESFNVMSLKLYNLKDENDREILIFSLKNIFQELLGEYVILFPVESWDRVYFLVRPRTGDFEVRLKKGITYLVDNFGIFVVCGFGENIDSLTHLQTSKMQADYMIEYLELTRRQVYAWYSDITADSKQTDDNFNHNLKKLIHQVMAQDYAECKNFVEEIFKTNIFACTETTLAQQRMATVVSVISIPYKERYGQKEFTPQLDSVKETYNLAVRLLTRLAEGEADTSGKQTFKHMKTYIEQHALDANITAGSVCEEVRISASYGSGMYKKFAGEGILDAIHKERIRQAKIMLQENLSVQEVAEKTGYLDARSFIRSFKKYEGITPGQFKNI